MKSDERGRRMEQAVMIGITGGTGSGKTTLAQRLKEAFADDVTLICMDWYYRSFNELSIEERRNVNFDHPNAFDMDLMCGHLTQLKHMQAVQRPVYSFVEYRRMDMTVREAPRHVVIVEGFLLFSSPEIRNLLDIKVFVDADADIRFSRRLVRDIHERGRDVDSVVGQYLKTVKPMHEAFVEPTKKHADIIVPEGGMNEVALTMLIDRIRSILDGAM